MSSDIIALQQTVYEVQVSKVSTGWAYELGYQIAAYHPSSTSQVYPLYMIVTVKSASDWGYTAACTTVIVWDTLISIPEYVLVTTFPSRDAWTD